MGSQFGLIYLPIASMSSFKMITTKLRGVGDKFATVRDTRDDFATILQRFLSHKFFEHVQNFRDPFAPVCDTCEEITTHGDCFKTALRPICECLSPAVAKQPQSTEIGALGSSI